MCILGLIVLFATVLEPKDSRDMVPMPIGILLVFALLLGLVIMLAIKGASFLVLNFEPGFLLVISAVVFAVVLVISSIVIRNKRWK